MAYLNNLQIVTYTEAEWATTRKDQLLSKRQLAYNSTTGEFRIGPGKYATLKTLPGAIAPTASVRCATTANITIATALNAGDAIDGITLVAGDLVLVKDQTAPAENGVYVAGTTPARATAFDTYDEHAGVLVYVQAGSTLAGAYYRNIDAAGGTLGTTAINFLKSVGARLDLSALAPFTGIASKAAPVDGDIVLIQDSQAQGALKRITALALKTYTNT